MGNRIEIQLGEHDSNKVTSEIKTETPEQFFAMDRIELSEKAIKEGVAQLEGDRLTTLESVKGIISAASMANKEAHLSPEGKHVNQDQMLTYFNEKKGVFAAGVFDGMGGYEGGELASLKIKEYFLEALKVLNNDSTREEIRLAVDGAIAGAVADLQKLAESNVRLKKADSTLTVGIGVIKDGRYTVHIFHVGDSKAYLYQAETGKLTQVTSDDSLVHEFEKAGVLSGLQAKIHPGKAVVNNSLKNVGDNGYQFFTLEDLQPGDRLDFFSDGVTDQFREDNLEGERSNELQTFIRDYNLTPTEIVSAAELRKKQGLGMATKEGNLALSKDDDATVVRFRVPRPEMKVEKEIPAVTRQALLNNETLKGILAYYINELEGSTKETRARITDKTIDDDIRKFLKEFPTEYDFIAQKGPGEFFENFTIGDRAKYERYMPIFQDLIYKG